MVNMRQFQLLNKAKLLKISDFTKFTENCNCFGLALSKRPQYSNCQKIKIKKHFLAQVK